jgi:hypothetical protein
LIHVQSIRQRPHAPCSPNRFFSGRKWSAKSDEIVPLARVLAAANHMAARSLPVCS